MEFHMMNKTFSCKDLMQRFKFIYGNGGKGPKAQSFVLKVQPINNLNADKALDILFLSDFPELQIISFECFDSSFRI